MGKAWIGNFKGPKGDPGAKGETGETGATGTRGTKWFSGVGITGASTAPTVFTGSGVTEALVDDFYINTKTGNVYRCTLGGDASVAKWVHDGNLKGPTGDFASCDSALSTTSTNPVQNKIVTTELKKKLEETGDASNTTVSFSAASAVATPTTGEKLSVILGKVSKAITELIAHMKVSGTTTTAGHLKLGTESGTACAGNDSRLSDARAPKDHEQSASTITKGTLKGEVVANAAAVATVGTKQVRNIYAGTAALADGASLPSGDIYIQYE